MEDKQDLVHRIIEDRYFNKLNEERKRCLTNWDALGYAILCNKLGIEPEIPLLYEQGEAELDKKYCLIRDTESFSQKI